jgi:RNA polymerase sigma-70 factor (ECF subfamily)
MDYPADQALLTRLRAGEQKAYRELVATYQGAMRAVAFAIVGSRNADEVVQDAWLAVVRNLDGFQGRSSLKTWLLTITANTAKSRLKGNRREVLLDDIPSPHGTIGDERFQGDGHWLLAPHAWHHDSPEALLTEEELRECLENTACPRCRAASCTCVNARGWNWRRFVIFCRCLSPMCGCCCTARALRYLRPLSILRRLANVEL